MKFLETQVKGVFEIRLEPHIDNRGFFARSWCMQEFEQHGLSLHFVQCNISFNERKGTLRGMHYQDAPFPEAKVVRCTQGAIYDVVVDLRCDSPDFRRWVGLTLTASERNMVYVPPGFGHGFVTLEDRSEVFYQMSEFYHPELTRGVRWNDPAFQIAWPEKVEVISERDRTYPDFEPK